MLLLSSCYLVACVSESCSKLACSFRVCLKIDRRTIFERATCGRWRVLSASKQVCLLSMLVSISSACTISAYSFITRSIFYSHFCKQLSTCSKVLSSRYPMTDPNISLSFLFCRADISFWMHCIASKRMILFSSIRIAVWLSMTLFELTERESTL